MSDDTVEKLRGDVARERVIRHLVEGGVNPDYAEFHVAKHGQFHTSETEVKVKTLQGWASGDAALKEYAGELLKGVPSKFKGENTDDSTSASYDAAAAGKAAGLEEKKRRDNSSLAFR
jgi:hypothetical protein